MRETVFPGADERTPSRPAVNRSRAQFIQPGDHVMNLMIPAVVTKENALDDIGCVAHFSAFTGLRRCRVAIR